MTPGARTRAARLARQRPVVPAPARTAPGDTLEASP